MMESETEVSEAATESPILDDPLASKSFVSYRSAMSTLSESHYHHPLFSSASNRLATSPADRDPLSPSLEDEDDRVSLCSHHGNNNNNNIDDALRAVGSDFDRIDAIISPLDENSNGGDVNGVESPTFSSDSLWNYSRSELSSSRSEYLRISVSDPRKEQEPSNSIVGGSNTFVTYLITTKTNMRGFVKQHR